MFKKYVQASKVQNMEIEGNSEPKQKKIIGKYRPIVFVSILLRSLEGGDFKISVQGAGKMSQVAPYMHIVQ